MQPAILQGFEKYPVRPASSARGAKHVQDEASIPAPAQSRRKCQRQPPAHRWGSQGSAWWAAPLDSYIGTPLGAGWGSRYGKTGAALPRARRACAVFVQPTLPSKYISRVKPAAEPFDPQNGLTGSQEE